MAGGRFDAFSVSITARALTCMSLGMIGYAAQAVLCRVYFAEQRGIVPLVAGGASIGVNLLLCVLLTGPLDVAGVAWASSAAFLVNALLLYFPLKKRGLEFGDRTFCLDGAKALMASVLMGAAVSACRGWLAPRTGRLVALGVPVLLGVLLYGVLVTVLGLPEAKLIVSQLKNRMKRGS